MNEGLFIFFRVIIMQYETSALFKKTVIELLMQSLPLNLAMEKTAHFLQYGTHIICNNLDFKTYG